ncbi:hypothetical protein BVY01_00675 [bacterium I07]|nr:hypothetical protein BVY01_00675 [bacterium I07]
MRNKIAIDLNESESLLQKFKSTGVIHDKCRLYLTNERLICVKNSPIKNHESIEPIQLTQISSTKVILRNPYYYLVFALLAFIFCYSMIIGASDYHGFLALSFILFAIVFIVLTFFFLFRYYLKTVRCIHVKQTNSEGFIHFPKSTSRKELEQVIHKIESAKRSRIKELKEQEENDTEITILKNIKEQLSELKSMLKDGLITQEEYEEKRNHLIAEL